MCIRDRAGSDGHSRTKSFDAAEENLAHQQPVHIAIVYQEDGTVIGYRNGIQYGKPFKTKLQEFSKEGSQVIFGMRHKGGKNNYLKGKIHRAQLYDRALEPNELAASAGVESNYVSESELVAALSKTNRNKRKALQDQLTGLSLSLIHI